MRVDHAVTQDIEQQQPERAGSAAHGPIMAGYLLVNGIMAPPLMSEPFIFASLGWGAAISINLVMALASWYCMFHQAKLFHYAGGRHCTYKRMGNAVLGPYMGRWGGLLIAALQYFINVGTTITNMILSGQLLQSVYNNLCTDKSHCSLTGTSAWIGISGALSYFVFMAVPDMSSLAWASICGTVLAVYYCIGGMVMSGLDGHASTAVYSISGAPKDLVFNGLNAVGMLLFLYGITVMPEIQDVLRPDRKTGNTSRPMIWAAAAAHAVFVPLYLLVGIIGYWAYGATVDPFLLFANSTPAGLVVSAELAAAVQIQFVSQVLMLPVFEAVERHVVDRFPNQRWLSRSPPQQQQQQAAKVHISWPLTPAASADVTAITHKASLASNMSELTRSLSSVTHHQPQHDVLQARLQEEGQQQQQHLTTGTAAAGSPHQLQEVWCLGSDAAANADCLVDSQQRQPAGSGKVEANGNTAKSATATAATAAGTEAAVVPSVLAVQRHSASVALICVNRTLMTGLMLFVACALPFFSSIMGFFGAVGFGPITYALPTILYMVAYKDGMSKYKWWFHLAFVVFWLLASLVAAIGAVYSIVTTASTYHFFS